VAVLLAVGALIWGFMQKDNAEEIAASQGAALQDAQEQIDADRAAEDELQQQLSRAKAAHDRVEQKLQTKKRDLKEEAAQLRGLRRDLATAQRNAEREEATLRDQARADEAQADLARKCAQVLATGMRVIYEAPTPQEVMDEVVKEMELASESCAGVVSVG
jgi:chromosome segregation ATPase